MLDFLDEVPAILWLDVVVAKNKTGRDVVAVKKKTHVQLLLWNTVAMNETRTKTHV